MTTITETDLIPVLDLEPLLAGDEAGIAALADQLRHALETVGFFFIVNHGIDWAMVRGIYERAHRMHALPQQVKDSITMNAKMGGYLQLGGGTSYASQIAGEVRKPNQNEALFIHGGGYREANQLPPIEGFGEFVGDYMEQVQALAMSLLPLLARSLGLEPGYFDEHFDEPSVTLRMSHYPVMEYEDDEWGLAPHTDSSIFTLLPANEVPGLEIRPEGHDWIEPPALSEAFLINSGDMLKRWTNDTYLSTAHRARNAADVDRYAIPFFFGARDDAIVDPVPGSVTEDNPLRYEPISYGDYQRWFLSRNYAAVTGAQADEVPPGTLIVD